MQALIQSREDLEALSPSEQSKFLVILKGSATVTVNSADYPDNYDSSLQEGAEGFVEPAWNKIENLGAIQRFGFATVMELDEYISINLQAIN